MGKEEGQDGQYGMSKPGSAVLRRRSLEEITNVDFDELADRWNYFGSEAQR
jgi:hypothetical protein